MKKTQLIAVFIICSLFLQGCSDEKLVSVTNIQLNPEHGRKGNYIEIAYSSKASPDEFQKESGITLLSSKTVLCYDKDKNLQLNSLVYYRNTVGYDNKSSTPEPNGEYLYSILVSVSDKYDLAASPQDVCTQIRGDWVAPAYRSDWIVIPKEVIAKALALPPDPEISEAYQREWKIDRFGKRLNTN